MRRFIFLFLAAVLSASAARAGSVAYEHPALKTRLTVHTADGASLPDAVSYEGPKGFYLITDGELRSLEHGDGWSEFRYDVRALKAQGFLRQEDPYRDAKPVSFADDACVAAIEKTIGELRGKQEAPDEFAARVAALRGRAASVQGTWRSYEAEAASAPGAFIDKSALDATEGPLAEAVAAVESARRVRVAGEYRASVAAPTGADPSPKADFYWRQGRALDAAEAALSRVSAKLESERIPNY
ncbi:MAG TPA: hypothetical protein VN915_12545 [Elusimicrobiota bacterium]|nr:hypothetical protein [Elusimicrobiota bacterium]